ncbi:cysteine-tryptophan domain-containing zinc finger protein 7-like isoform X2 [Euphorbia lathyris]|uniref:cysteine-tryptophan domain-containing zinc finger protein 7-like isoform X2 n=1 Tax=Euphorbia lathyris TaxID=212925 RepID=UPI003313159D
MDENPEPEEGEAFQYNGGGCSNNNMDPDIALSYIDEKIQTFLGHFQKDFAGSCSAENLGPKYGGYGSFLPTYARSPPRNSLSSHPKTPQRNCSTQRSPNNLPVEGVSQSLKVPLNDAAPVKLRISSGRSNALRESGLASGNVSAKQESSFSKNPHKSGCFPDQRTLKVRIKVGPDSAARKNAAIYSGLGLDNSPSSSLGNSPEVSGGMPSQKTADECPTSILKAMTSFPVPGGAIVSPLHENLLCLMKKERFSMDVKPVPFLKGGQTNSALLAKESVSLVGKLSKEKGAKFPTKREKAVEVNHGNDIIFGNDTTFPTKMKLENENPESKNVVSNNLKNMPLPGTANGYGTRKITGRPTEVPLEGDGVGGRIFSSDLIKEDSLESRSGQDSGKSEKSFAQTQSGSVEKVPELQELPYSNGGSVHLKGSKKPKKSKAPAPSKAWSDASEDLPSGSLAPSKPKVVQQAACVQDKFLMSSAKEKPLSEGKKLHSSKGSKKAVAHGSVEIGVNRESRDLTEATHGVSKSQDKMQKLRFQDSSKFRENLKNHTKIEKKDSQMRSLERPSGNKRKDSTIGGFGMVHNASFDNSKQGFSGKQVDKELIHSSVKDVANLGISPAQNALASEVAPPAPNPNPVLIEENWVCCDSCQKWRLLPYGTLPEHLPEKWLCSMLNWLPGKNRCDISEEETTKALNALYQVPLATGQNNLQNDTSRTTSGVHVDHSVQSLNCLAGPTQAKKKHGLKEIAKAGISSGMMRSSNSLNNHLQESLKSRSVNNMNQPPAEANLVNKSSLYTLSKSQNLVPEVKRNPLGGGNTKQIKMKNKRLADHDGYGNIKKIKTDLSDGDKYCNSDTGLGRMGLNSKSGLSIKVRGKDLLKSNECSFSGDVKCDTKERLPVSVKKLCDQSQISSGGGSLNVGTSDKRNISLKKRKMKEWQDDQNGLDSTGNDEDSSGTGLKKVKKLKVSKSGASIMNNSREKLDKKEVVAHSLSSGSQDHAVDGVNAERRIRKDQRPWKHRGNFTSQQHLDATDSSRKYPGLAQVSMTATSSSSKVSGSFKTQTTLDDAKGSPVESVSSSPMRIPFSEKLGSTGCDILGKDNATNGDFPVIDVLKTRWDQKGDDQINQSGTGKMEKLSGVPHPKSFKVLPLDYQDGDPKPKVHQTKCSSQLLNGRGEIMKQHKSPVDVFATKNCHNEVRVEKNLSENMLPLHKSGKGPSLQFKENNRSSIADFDRDQKLSEPGNAQVDIFNKRTGKEGEVDLRSHAPPRKRMNNAKHSIPDKRSSKFCKDEKVHVNRSNSESQFSKDGRVEIPLKHDPNDTNKKMVSLDSKKRDTGPRGNLVPGCDNDTKVYSVQKELRPETSSLVAHAESEAIHESRIHQSTQGSQRERASDGHFAHAPGNDDVSKASLHPGSCEKMNGVQIMLDAKNVKDINAPIPASSQTATEILEKAKELRDYADVLKNSGFGFESNETNFQAARKFLHGASLLETSNEVGRQGEMTQIQAYSITAKLCECSAVEYERRCEMATAALAYKCLEVAHWRIVYCKNSSLSRDRNELQACLQTFSQGESPSSSASDIDNLNNQAIVEKATVSKGTIPHIAGNSVIVARNHASVLRVLDFTQDVDAAVEASRKSLNAYTAANVALEEAQNKDCIASVKKVIDFGFQDVEELLHLVQQATEAIACRIG